MDRRRFLSLTGRGALAGRVAGAGWLGLAAGTPRPLLGARLPAAGSALGPIGLQLYTVRTLMRESVEETLERVARIGYREVEFAGYFGREPATLRRLLDDLGLTAPSAHVGFPDPDGIEEIFDAAETVGHRQLIVPWIPPTERESLDRYRAVADRLEEWGGRARERGLRVGYHNHSFEFERRPERAGGEVDETAPLPLELLLERTDPALVTFQADLFWMRVAGIDIGEWLRRYSGRFSSLHLKDMAVDGAMVPVGDGVMDFASLVATAREHGARHLYVEHDEPTDPVRAVERSFHHLSALEIP